MTSTCKKYLLVAISALILIATILLLCRKVKSQKTEINRLKNNVTTLCEEAEQYKIRDSVLVTEQGALEMTVKELKQLRADDAELIADLRKKPKDVKYITSTETVTRDSVVYILRDSCLTYQDRWVKFAACLTDSTLDYSVRDSVVTVVFVDYARRFLWWRWRPSYKVDVVNFNPHSEIVKSETVIMK